MSELARSSFSHDGLTFSYLDSGGEKPVLLMLHAHWMGASDFEGIAPAFTPAWRVVALDQRGHGFTDHTRQHGPKNYVGDIAALLRHIGIDEPVVLLGHSFGGMTAYLYAAAHPVRGLIIEEMDVVRNDDDTFVLEWGGVYPTRAALEAKIGERLAPYLAKSIKQIDGGFTLRWDPHELLESERSLNGDHWSAWMASQCAALVIGGTESRVIKREALEAMAMRRPHTKLVMIEGAGHSVHIDKPAETIAAIEGFLSSLPQ